MTVERPVIENAPGLTWRLLKGGWECRWRPRTDIARKGYRPKVVRLWAASKAFPDLDDVTREWIAERANALQNEMLTWSRGGIPETVMFDGRIASLVINYQSDKDSPYHEKRYHTRQFYDTLCRRITKDCGTDAIADIDARRLKRLYEMWAVDGKIAMGHSLIGMMRTLMTFGATLLKSPECREIKILLHDMRFKMPKRRSQVITAEQVEALRKAAHAKGYHSIALANAIQWDLMLRQKDVIGEWVPISETPPSAVIDGNRKWLRGITAQEIDPNLILRHTTSKRDKDIEVDLHLAPMVLEEIRHLAGIRADAPVLREHLPNSGPLIVNEFTGLPFSADYFRKAWRELATECGIPKSVRNMDSRAGAITEASDAGVPMEHIRQTATHSDISTTAGYSRGQATKAAETMKARVEYRNKKRTETR